MYKAPPGPDTPNVQLKMIPKEKYTCSDYREEMRLIGLKKRLNEDTLNPTEKQIIEAEINDLEKTLLLD